MGAVAKIGLIESNEELSITQVLTKAGGPTDNQLLENVKVIRGNPMSKERIINVDMEKYLTDGESSTLPKLYSGDTVYVPPLTPENIRQMSIVITGQVTNPGSYLSYKAIDILNAISMAGGFTVTADPSKIWIRREGKDDYQDKIVDLKEIMKDPRVSTELEMIGPGYIIYVPIKEQGMATKTAITTRGIVTFIADLIPIYGLYRIITE